MRKLTLTLEQLEVDTFVAGPAGVSPGTVRAHDTVPGPGPSSIAFASALTGTGAW